VQTISNPGSANEYTHYELVIATGKPKSHHTLTIEHVDNGFGSPLGYAIDNLHIYDIV
jgi:hypothetical protein